MTPKTTSEGRAGRTIPKGEVDDAINPSHYRQGGIQPIDFIDSQNLNFNLGNVVKYAVRAPHKNGLEDLKKARWYLNREIERWEVEGQT